MAESSKPQTPPTPPPPRTTKEIFNELFYSIRNWFQDLVDLKEGMDREGTIVAIKNNKKVRGANAWLLMCSIMIASLGLDLNSPAVIIGAMLISPLMSPILGVGLAIGINDREALFISLQHFMIAIVIALVTSTLYFAVTPLGQGEATDEILSRTKPTVLDGLVAVFGGLAGIISSSRKEKSSAIPGVAIATALMPPLCVTGYGIANLLTREGNMMVNWYVTLNSFYLFFLNSFFITLTTYVIIRLLNFPFKAHVNAREARRTRWIIGIFSMIIIIPSVNILIDLYEEQQITRKLEEFKENFFEGPEAPARCINSLIKQEGDSVQVILELLGETVDENNDAYYHFLTDSLHLDNVKLSFIQDRDVGLDQLDNMQLQISNLGSIANELKTVHKAKTEQEKEIERLRSELDSIRRDTIPFLKICEEAKVVFPDLTKVGYAKAQITDFDQSVPQLPVFLVKWEAKKSRYAQTQDEEKLYNFLKIRANLDTLELVRY